MTSSRWQKLGIIAGGGALPLRIASACIARGEDFFVIRIQGAAGDELADFPGSDCGIAEIGKMQRLLKENNCDAAVFAGIVQRPDFTALKPDWRGAALLPKVLAAAGKGDGALLKVMVDAFEGEGFTIIGADEAANSLAAPAGALGVHSPSRNDLNDMRKAANVVAALGNFDVGQGAIVANGLVLAIEAAEGTDAMLERCAALLKDMPPESPSGVMVKRPKPDQELRVDLPTIGPVTVRRARDAGLAGIAVEAEKALIIDQEETIRLADEAGLFIYGFSPKEVEGP